MNEDSLDEAMSQIKDIVRDLRAGVCPVWQCGGDLEYLEDRTNWQEPDLKCKNCGKVWLIQKYNNEEASP